MSIYKPKGKGGKFKTPYYHYDFVITTSDGRRVRGRGSTGETSKERAREFEERVRRRLKDGRLNDGMTLLQACRRYLREVAVHQVSSSGTENSLSHCCRLLGPDRLLVDITGHDVNDARARRALETYGSKNPKLVSKSTVNRQIVEPLRRVLRRARRFWGVSCDYDAIPWNEIRFKEPKERVRALSEAEEKALWEEIRPDYKPFVWFLAQRGFRVRGALGMKKRDLNLSESRVRIHMKGEGLEWQRVSSQVVELIRQEMEKSDLPQVWTYQPQRGRENAARRPITYAGLRSEMERALRAAGIEDFRIHDLRHDFATKLLRRTKNLPLVQKALHHKNITSTARYAHVLDEDIAEGLETMNRKIPGADQE